MLFRLYTKYAMLFFSLLLVFLTVPILRRVYRDILYSEKSSDVRDFKEDGRYFSIDEMSQTQNDSSSTYLINTFNCTIPKTSIFTNKIRRYMSRKFPLTDPESYCKFAEGYKPPLIASNTNTLYIVSESIITYKTSSKDKLKCWYSPFYKDGPDNKRGHVKYSKDMPLNNSISIPPNVEFVAVKCQINGTTVYKDYQAFVRRISLARSTNTSRHRINVLIYGIDSLSRINFHRQMTRTSNLIEKLNFIEYFGYNKVGDNTFPNLIPFLTGYTESELKSLCLFDRRTYFDECPFIWKKYKQYNYTSALIEELSLLSMFRFVNKAGFAKSPTDHYYYTFDREASLGIGHKKPGYRKLCLGSRLSLQVFLDYNTKMIESLKDEALFKFSWAVTLSHDDLNLPRAADLMYHKFFTFLNNSGMFESSVVILMSDHGLRFGKILLTKEGYMEERLPLFTVSFPSWFFDEYPLAYANFIANSRRLTTHFDAHETLNDLANLDNLRDEIIQRRTIELNTSAKLPRGISLFLPIPLTRTCFSAGIPFMFCACMAAVDNFTINWDISKQAANVLVSTINEKLQPYTKCVKLRLRSIKRVERVEIDGKHFFSTSIQTNPSNGIFQALLRYSEENKTQLQIVGSITRLNAFANQSICVNINELKLFCYCK